MSMTLQTLDFLRLLPAFMREDTAVQGLAAGLDAVIPPLAEQIKTLSTWDQLDELSEAELDALAWELNILWYELDADITVKRDLVRNSDMVYRHLGTKWAVENVIRSYFGTGRVEEWFDYGGRPGYFRVYSSNPAITGERLASFLHLLYKIKRASAKLEAIWLELESTATLTYGAVTEAAATMDVWPLVPRAVESTGEVAAPGALSVRATLEIYPTGGLTHA